MTSTTASRTWAARATAVVPALCLLAVLVCMVRFAHDRITLDEAAVFRGPDDVALVGADGWFHARHALHAAHAWPSIIRFDGGAAYPGGLRTTHVGLWDVALGGAVGLWHGDDPDEAGALRVLAFAGPVAGSLCVVVVAATSWLLLRRRRSGAAVAAAVPSALGAAAAAVLLVMCPAHYANAARLGEVDHHVVEPLLALLSCTGLAGACAVRGRARWRWMVAALGALPPLAFLFTWAGAPLPVGLMAAGILGAGALQATRLSTGDDDDDLAGAWRWAVVLLAGVAILAAVRPLWTMDPLLRRAVLGTLGSLVVLLGVARLMGGWSWWRGRPLRVRGLVLAVVVVGSALAVWRWPSARWFIDELLRPRATTVAEHREVVLQDIFAQHGIAAVVATAVLATAIWRVLRGGPVRIPAAAFVFVVVGITGLWVAVHDFGTAVAPLLAAAAGVGVGQWTAAWSTTSRRSRVSLASVAAVAVIMGVTAPRWSGRPALSLPPASSGGRILLTPAWRDAVAWVRQARPQPAFDVTTASAEPPDMDLAGTVGVLAGWDRGHMVATLARRPTVADHGPSVAAARVWTAPDEASALGRLCPSCGPGEAVRFVIVDAGTVHIGLHPNLSLIGAPLAPHLVTRRVPMGDTVVDVTTVGGGLSSFGVQLWATPFAGFEHLRAAWQSSTQSVATHQVELVSGEPVSTPRVIEVNARTAAACATLARSTTTSPQAVRVDGGVLLGGLLGADVTVFEVVAGAVVDVDAGPGLDVTVQIPLRTPLGPVTWQQRRATDATGVAHFVVPHPTGAAASADPTHGNITADGPAAVLVDGVLVATVAISVDDVEQGRTLLVKPGGGAAAQAPATPSPPSPPTR
jgi:asparagine N-glycosylation enzyme membrane subunit Stt3